MLDVGHSPVLVDVSPVEACEFVGRELLEGEASVQSTRSESWRLVGPVAGGDWPVSPARWRGELRLRWGDGPAGWPSPPGEG